MPPHPYGFPKYAVSHQMDTGADKTILGLFGGSLVRPWLYHIAIGFDATPANRRYRFDLVRTDDGGVAPAAALTATRLDPLMRASFLDTSTELPGGAWLVEPAVLTVVMPLVVPQRRNLQWWAEPGREITHTAGSGHGIALVCRNSPSINCNTVLHWFEEAGTIPV